MSDTLQAAKDRARTLCQHYAGRSGVELLYPMIQQEFRGRIALVSSFGTEAAVLLALAVEVDRNLPVIFLDTGKHFGKTLRYRDELVHVLGLRDVRSVGPETGAIPYADRDEMLSSQDSDACCYNRKILPLRQALNEFDAWITGRKRYQGGLRGSLPAIEAENGKIKINPLASWTQEQVESVFAARGLPRHPLEADGFLSVGCMPCTDPVEPGDNQDRRAGRWADDDKTECGIHMPGE